MKQLTDSMYIAGNQDLQSTDDGIIWRNILIQSIVLFVILNLVNPGIFIRFGQGWRSHLS
jgi:hypothetical protein